MNKGQGSDPADTLFIVAGVPLALALLGFMFPTPFSWVWHWLTWVEVQFLSRLPDFLLTDAVKRALPIIQAGLEHKAAGSVSWKAIFKVEMTLFPYNNLLYTLVLSLFALYIRLFATSHHRRHSTETLIDEQTRYWRFSRMWVKHNPLRDKDVNKGPFRIPPSPERFAREHRLLRKVAGRPPEFLPDPARAVFREAVGPAISDLTKIADRHVRWLFAAMIVRADRKKDLSDRLLGDMSCHYADEFDANVIDKECRAILREYADHEITRRLLERHAFVRSFACALYMEAKACGKFTTSMFSWLMLEDRELFFALNNMGRPAYFLEGLVGAIHHDRETNAGYAISDPEKSIEAAVEVLRFGLIDDGILAPNPEDLEKMSPTHRSAS